jgi:hemoglobin
MDAETDFVRELHGDCGVSPLEAGSQADINQKEGGGNPMSLQSSHSALSRSVACAKEVTMPQTVSTSVTRRSVVTALALTTAPMTVLAAADKAHAQAKQSMPEKSLYERLGGVFAIAAVVDHFSDALVENPIVGQKSQNPQLQEWHTKNLGRLPGLKFMRTLWVCNVSGGPFQFAATKPGKTPLGLEEAHRDLRITPAEFDEVAAELGRTLDFFKVPQREKGEVLVAFAAHKDEVTAGYVAAVKPR